jgi:hypothetical protein
MDPHTRLLADMTLLYALYIARSVVRMPARIGTEIGKSPEQSECNEGMA